MDFGKLLNRALTLVVEHKFLIILGILAALGGSPGSNSSWQFSGGDGGSGNSGPNQEFPFAPDMGFDAPAWFPAVTVSLIAVLIGLFLVIAIAFFVVSSIASGGMVSAVETIETGGVSGFSHAWIAGWHRAWPLVGIGLIPAIPLLIMLGAGVAVLVTTIGLSNARFDPGLFAPGLIIAVLCGVCLLIPVMLVLMLLRTLAERACMLEETGVFASYRRGWHVLVQNLGPVLILFLLQVGLMIALFVVLFLPTIVMTICCILWPLMLVINGAVAAYFSTLWTLAWREWTGQEAVAVATT